MSRSGADTKVSAPELGSSMKSPDFIPAIIMLPERVRPKLPIASDSDIARTSPLDGLKRLSAGPRMSTHHRTWSRSHQIVHSPKTSSLRITHSATIVIGIPQFASDVRAHGSAPTLAPIIAPSFGG